MICGCLLSTYAESGPCRLSPSSAGMRGLGVRARMRCFFTHKAAAAFKEVGPTRALILEGVEWGFEP